MTPRARLGIWKQAPACSQLSGKNEPFKWPRPDKDASILAPFTWGFSPSTRQRPWQGPAGRPRGWTVAEAGPDRA